MDETEERTDSSPELPEQEAVDLSLDGELMPLVEKAVREDGTIPIKIIAPGWGSSGYYPADVLERDGPKVFTGGLHTYWNHPSVSEARERPERDLRDLAGVLTKDAYYDANGPAGPGLYGETRVVGAYRGAVADLAPHIGMSIRAFGKAREGEADGRKGKVIQELVAAQSVDFVTTPGAGGKILELFEAAGRDPAKEVEIVTPEEAQALREKNEALQAQIARLQEGLLLRQAQELATQILTGIDMPAPTRQRVLAAQAAKPVLTSEGALDDAAYRTQVEEAARAELAYINEVRGSGKIIGMGSTSGGPGGHEALVEAFTKAGLSPELAAIAAKGR